MRIIRVLMLVLAIGLSASIAYAGGATALTYQGRLLDAGEPANGLFDVDFSLWDDPAAGSQIGSTVTFISLPITDGLFTVELDFGANAFDNSDRWLRIVVDGVPLTPRQPMTRAPYAIQTRGIVVDDDQHVGMGVSPSSARLRAWNFAGNAFEALSSSRAVEAISTGDMAILASNQSANGMGLFAQHQPSQNQGWLGTPDYGVYGKALDVANDWAGYFLGNGYFSGFVGIGTSEPEAPLHVHEGSAGDVAAQVNSIAVFERSGHGFISILTPDASERGILFGDPEFLANGAIVYNNPTVPDGFEFRTGGNNTNMVIDATGNVGIGTTSPDYRLQVESTDFITLSVFNNATSGTQYGVRSINNSTSGRAIFGHAGANSGVAYGVLGSASSPDGFGVYSSGNVCTTGSYLICSDARFKRNVRPLADSLDKVLKLRGVQFDWKRDEFPDHNFSEDRQVGFIAQEVAKVLPELVAGGGGDNEFYTVSYGRIVPVLVEAVKELNGEVEHKDSQITELQARLTALEAVVDRLVLDRNGGAK